MSDFKAEIHKIRFPLAPDPSGGGYSAHQTPWLYLRGLLLKGGRGKGRGQAPKYFGLEPPPLACTVRVFYISPDPHLKAVNYKKMQKPSVAPLYSMWLTRWQHPTSDTGDQQLTVCFAYLVELSQHDNCQHQHCHSVLTTVFG